VIITGPEQLSKTPVTAPILGAGIADAQLTVTGPGHIN
jgi:hypothetical protein